MRGEERELTEEAEVLEDLETSELACVDLYGLVSQVQLRGKRLAFLFISLIGTTDALQRVVFDRRRFDESSALGFPTTGSCEQCVHILAESALQSSDLFAKRWEIFLPAATLPPAISMATSTRSECSWVCCPLCPRSMRRFRLGRGLQEHLDAVHGADRPGNHDRADWHLKMEGSAKARGIFAQRSAAGLGGQRRGAFVGHEADALPALPALPALSGDVLDGFDGLAAAGRGDATALQRFLDAGWNLYAPGSLDRHGASALDWASGNGHIHCVELLLEASACPLKATRLDGRACGHWAARFGRTEVLKLLLSCQVHPDVRTTTGITPLMLASYAGHTDACQILLDRRANLHHRNAFDCDAGHFAAMGGDVEMCRWLIHHGISFSRPQCSGHTGVHKAAECGSLDVLYFLLDQNAVTEEEIKKVRANGLPSKTAEREGHLECQRLLEKAGL